MCIMVHQTSVVFSPREPCVGFINLTGELLCFADHI